MNYKTRFLEQRVKEAVRAFSVVVVTGPRQAGKTSMLLKIGRSLFPELDVVSFDTPDEVDAFRRDPALFFANHPGVLLLDEIQHAPDVLPYVKQEVDRAPGRFRFFLSGSQPFHVMRGVSESLAGRAAVLDLWPFCTQEANGVPDRYDAIETLDLLENPAALAGLLGREYPCNDTRDVLPAMLAGGMPSMLVNEAGPAWLESYRRTYIQRDIRELSQVADLGRFNRFTVLIAGLTGTTLNKAELARDVGIDNKTVEHWLSLLESSYQLVHLQPWFRNSGKRLVKRPKYLFADMGLCLHLQGIRDAQALSLSPYFGRLFETFALMELRKLFAHAGRAWEGCYWRTPQGVECDLVLPAGGRLTPIEIKHGGTIRSDDTAGLRGFMALYKDSTAGMLLSLHPRVEQLTERIWNLPLGLILKGPRPE